MQRAIIFKKLCNAAPACLLFKQKTQNLEVREFSGKSSNTEFQ